MIRNQNQKYDDFQCVCAGGERERERDHMRAKLS